MNLEIRIMRRWRFIPFVTLALALLAVPARLPAQEAAKKDCSSAGAGCHGSGCRLPAQRLPPPRKSSITSGSRPTRLMASVEKISLWVVLGIAVAGLIYALGLVNQVVGADEGTERMREVGAAIRQGANAYLARQFKAIAPLMVVLTGLLWVTAESTQQVALGRAAAFFMGATFSWTGRLRGDEPGGAG